jgi:DNA replication protein DnaC
MSMMHQQTIEKLREMKLHGLAAAWQEQQARADVAGLDFDERFGLLIDAEWMTRINARLQRNLKEAHLKFSGACLEDLDHDDRRHIDKNLIRQLATCQWVTAHQNIAITGMTGTGKTFLACALAQHALRRRYRAIYRRTSRLFDELALARADGTYARLLARLAAPRRTSRPGRRRSRAGRHRTGGRRRGRPPTEYPRGASTGGGCSPRRSRRRRP